MKDPQKIWKSGVKPEVTQDAPKKETPAPKQLVILPPGTVIVDEAKQI